MKALVLCAGPGSRLGELTEHTPRPMLRVAGQPVIAHNLRWLSEHGVTEVVVNLHHLGESIEGFVGDGAAFGLHVRYSREPELLGTAGALRPVADFFRAAPFLVLHGGTLHDFDLGKLFAAHLQNVGVATIAVFSSLVSTMPTAGNRRVEMDRSGRILRFAPADLAPDLELVSAGCHVLEPVLLDHVAPGRASSLCKDLFPLVLRQQGVLCGHHIDGHCFEIDTLESLARVQSMFGARLSSDPGE